ncbi:hypothetical protein WOLCODRAFT_155302 [Wolfiporia cocos MD-104 SS10]|uniref:Uncharacterized protein n=1 Tax=Wolfiporia cocos (strain MD-104) TaxID=742152 RepID=A0A2H3IXC5_WOLCO|nr:hypothetical protein WOLCODRAFT_155302 [Wolfiporia cocos MD-104 SS10]
MAQGVSRRSRTLHWSQHRVEGSDEADTRSGPLEAGRRRVRATISDAATVHKQVIPNLTFARSARQYADLSPRPHTPEPGPKCGARLSEFDGDASPPRAASRAGWELRWPCTGVNKGEARGIPAPERQTPSARKGNAGMPCGHGRELAWPLGLGGGSARATTVRAQVNCLRWQRAGGLPAMRFVLGPLRKAPRALAGVVHRTVRNDSGSGCPRTRRKEGPTLALAGELPSFCSSRPQRAAHA